MLHSARVIFRFLVLLVPIILLSIFGSLRIMEKLEQRWMSSDLNRRSRLIEESANEYIVESLAGGRTAAISRLLNRLSKDERLSGLYLCSPEGILLARSDSAELQTDCQANPSKAASEFQDSNHHRTVVPITSTFGPQRPDEKPVAKLVVVHDTSYMRQRHETTAKYLVFLLCALSLLLLGIMLVIYRWSMGATIARMTKVFKGALRGELPHSDRSILRGELSPLARDLSKVIRELRHAKAKNQTAEAATSWTPERLRAETQRLFGDSQLCIIANREPYIHSKKGGKIDVQFPASGLVTAVEPIVRACSGLWIGHGSGNADRETSDSNGKLLVPPGAPEYALKRVWLSKAEEQGYYYGFSNEGMWPLCHIAHARPRFDSSDWAQYKIVNERFAKSFADEKWEGNPVVLIQDYHFALLPQLIRERRKDALVSLFWHIPWTNPEAFGICPWRKEILAGMLGADLIGFHTQFHCNNFLDTVDRYLEARVDRARFAVTYQGHTCYVKPFPISVEWPARHSLPASEFDRERADLLNELNLPEGIRIGLGVDRVDYTKGIVERLQSVEKLLEKYPEWIGKFTFVQIGAPSRTHIKRYQDLNAEVQEEADRINWKFSQADVPPITLRLAHHNAAEIFRLYRAADLCLVNPLHDGMNLVCKEYIAAREDLQGVLILSTFAGAARELTDAILINPYHLDECADALHRALKMPAGEQNERMGRMRAAVSEHNVYFWAASFLGEMQRISLIKTKPA
jgi:trehalose-6-phosphate synthase